MLLSPSNIADPKSHTWTDPHIHPSVGNTLHVLTVSDCADHQY